MSENSNIGNRIAEYFRYIRDELSGRERNAFERELQKDLFADEAFEGFSGISEKEALEDLLKLDKNIRKRTSRRNRAFIYRMAGIVALFITVSSIVVITIVKKPDNQLAINAVKPGIFEISKGQAIIESDSKENSTSVSREEIARSDKAKDQKIIVTDKTQAPDRIEINDIASDTKGIPQKNEILYELASAPEAMKARKKYASDYIIRGKVLSTEDNLPIPGANIFLKGTKEGVITDQDGNFSIHLPDSTKQIIVASFIGMNSGEFAATPGSQLQVKLEPSLESLSEVVVTGYGTRKSDIEEEDFTAYTHPEPVSGRLKFNEFVKNNLQRPEGTEDGKKVVVVLSFIVRFSGQIDSIRVIKSPGKPYSDEAIRILKSGPEWKPAVTDGKTIEENVRIRIVFR